MSVASAFRLSVPVGEHDHARGPDDAAATVVEYGDYECSYCGTAEYAIEEIEDRGIGEVRFVFRHFPNRLIHPRARLAAEAAEAAGAQGKFWEMHRLLFDNQDRLEEEHLHEYARTLGLDMERFRRELQERVYAERVREQFRGGVKSGVRGTPTWFINGARYDGAWDAESLLEAIRKPLGVRIREIGQEFARMAASGGLMILLFSLLALIWANSPLGQDYRQLWELRLGIQLGGLSLNQDLLHWVNDGLMAIFFFVVGLEIKREVTTGELNSPSKAALPLVAAVGGMAIPALIYAAINRGDPEALRGWGIPVATDIAFALAILTVLRGRIPLSLRIFFTAMAIADDLGAILVLALFYSKQLSPVGLGVGAVLLLMLLLLNRWRVYSPLPYALIGLGLWLAFMQSGIHPTIAGVLLAITIPTRSQADIDRLLAQTDTVLNRYDYSEVHDESKERAVARTLQTILERIEPPAQRLEHSLQPWTTYLILPLFALANAGLDLGGPSTELLHPVSLGVILGLALGKPLGITVFSWLATRLGIAELPRGVSWPQFLSASILAGIGFTVSLFITGAAFDNPTLLASAKLGILIGSVFTAVLGFAALMATSPRYDMRTGSTRELAGPALAEL